ncbi:hydroxypyruvate reductase [Roseovarius pacificus]|uniref:Hydroxypyruvate reductase n=1 Tax=Roseovarius pacificus TaxID=337701 RepID=A0A1M7B179_9RHOB|nr:D-glycerate dehydrogenase [Roseovarius pacificus]GGO54558.1 D-glycerate dehydrogenase [Roseovarius pacificus]SHL48735.1 hydroxypyruvate reductase [Roseovarius pacificus]
MSRVYLTRPLPEAVLTRARALFDEVEVRHDTAPLKIGQMRAALTLYDGVLPTLGDMFSAEVFRDAESPRCKVLANFGVGYNHIDVAAARAAGVMVTNTPGAVTDATADIAMTLILMSARRAGEGERLVRAGGWAGWHPTQMLGLHVTGKTVGIIGMGRIGQAIARRCHFGFGMNVIYYNRSEKDLGFDADRAETMQDLAAKADIVVVAVPGGVETHHLIGADLFSAMKPTAHFVNIARGDIVDEAALIAALGSGQIAGAGLDVYEHEPKVPDALRALENVVLLPHLGTAALEVREAMGLMAVENLSAALNGETPPNLIS